MNFRCRSKNGNANLRDVEPTITMAMFQDLLAESTGIEPKFQKSNRFLNNLLIKQDLFKNYQLFIGNQKIVQNSSQKIVSILTFNF